MKKKIHYHKGTKIMGDTLCGRLTEFNQIEGNVGRIKVNCKICVKKRRL